VLSPPGKGDSPLAAKAPEVPVQSSRRPPPGPGNQAIEPPAKPLEPRIICQDTREARQNSDMPNCQVWQAVFLFPV